MVPRKKRVADGSRAFQLKVTLRGIRPPIWRRFLVSDDIELLKLRELLQRVMGWTDSHLHQFIVGGTRFNLPELDLPPPRKDERSMRLRDVLKKPKDRLVYEYDFGDSWEHDVVLEEVAEIEPGTKYPYVLAGKRACPPEDCGGTLGYEHLLEVLADPKHPDYKDMLEWVGGSFDPEAFDPAEINQVFHVDRQLPKERAVRSKTALSRQRTLRMAVGRGR